MKIRVNPVGPQP